MPGPLPQEQKRRRNSPTIPTTSLPAGGRVDPAPALPEWVELHDAGRAWWLWAWATPQAAGWASGHESLVARRASLEDDAAALLEVDGLDLAEVLGIEKPNEMVRRVEDVVRTLARMSGGRLALCREMRELDDRLGLSPKGMAALRWTITADEPEPKAKSDGNVVTPGRWQKPA